MIRICSDIDPDLCCWVRTCIDLRCLCCYCVFLEMIEVHVFLILFI
ncbi:hypothetical protein MtrunA17_Chr1g0180041 [Medicago truncatula]|uniref:Uncharacterized protein n=1 Tax=Medicago truncatula TaxID=3880 RepID=A0A396JYH5_MEDTR|nr:hypothetical protein MtrunA17_Chr1g0180041 [Medicago truncatula]